MPFDPNSLWPDDYDVWPTIEEDQTLGATDEEGDLLIRRIMDALASIEFDIGPRGGAAIPGQIRHGAELVLTSYTPAAFGISGLTCPSSWSGVYARSGARGFVAGRGKVTGDWTGPGSSFVEVSLPAGLITPGGTIEAVRGTAYVVPMPSAFGLHWAMQPVLHPAANRLRFIAPQIVTVSGTDVLGPYQFACNGVQTPGQFTGDGSPSNQDEIYFAVDCYMEDA